MTSEDFEQWFNDRTPQELGQILLDFFMENIVEEEYEVECSECSKREAAIKFHKESITKYDDKEVAAISLLALYQLDKESIDEKVESGLKRLGIID
ncbi:MAG: hypothetical protein WC503_01195 [Candidatus Shapirobacteria bacterium]